MSGFFARAGGRCAEIERSVSALADDLRDAGIPALAGVCQIVAERLGKTAFDAGRNAADHERISDDAYDCAQALHEVAEGVAGIDGELAERARTAAGALERLGRDAISDTQPLP